MIGITLSISEYIALLGVVLALGVGIGWATERELVHRRRQAWLARNRPRRRQNNAFSSGLGTEEWTQAAPRPPDAADQLRIVMNADFAIQPLLNQAEARVFRELDRYVLECNPGWLVMAQVSLGEVLRSRDTAAFRCVNSKRVDLLLVDEHCHPMHAIEYQGGAHHQGSAAARDAVKKEALRRAGIGYHEVVQGQTTRADLRRLVEKLVKRPEAAA